MLFGPGEDRVLGRDVDDVAAEFLLDQHLRRRLGDQEGAFGHHVVLQIPIGDGGVQQRFGQRQAGVVDDQIQPAEREHRRVDSSLHGRPRRSHSPPPRWPHPSCRSPPPRLGPSPDPNRRSPHTPLRRRAGSAMALPMPEAAPVTRAIRDANGFGFGIRASLASSSAQYSMRNFSASSIGA